PTPAPWPRRGAPDDIGPPYTRNVYTMIHPAVLTPAAASAMAPAIQIGRMDVPAEVDAEFNAWYNTVYVPNYETVPGVIRGRRYRAVAGSPTYLTFYEFTHPAVSESAAWLAPRDAVPAC